MNATAQIARFYTGRSLVLMGLAVVSSIALILIDATPFVDNYFGYALYVIPSLVIVWAVIGIWSAVLCILYSRRLSWKQGVLPGLLLVAATCVAFNFFPFVRGCNYIGGVLRFVMTRSYYDQQVALLPKDDKPRLAVFIWGGMVMASKGVVYDESDEIALPFGQQSAAWKTKAFNNQLDCGNWDARRLWSHYYLVGFPC